MKVTKALRDHAIKTWGMSADATDAQINKTAGAKLLAGGITAKQLAELRKDGDAPPDKAKDLFNTARVKSPSERLSTKRTTATTKAGAPLTWGDGGRVLESPSDFDKAVCGAFFKQAMRKMGMTDRPLSELERALIAESAEKGKWVGRGLDFDYGGGDAFIPAHEVKTILDDTVSGGIYMNPVALDEAVIIYPLLHSELLPYVDVKDVTGRRIITPTLQNMVVTWSTGAGSQATPMSTAGLIGDVDTAIFPVNGFIEVGNDLVADSPIQIGETVISLFGERLKAELDKVILIGDGVTQPLGITQATGLTAVNSVNGSPGPLTVSDAEALTFAVPVQYRRKDWNPCFISSDTGYRRFRQINVGNGDERRVFGMDEQSYKLMEYDYKVGNDLTTGKYLFGCLKRYRLFRRLGLEFVREQGGRQLQLANTTLLGIRARFGGQPVDPAAFALMTDGMAS